MAKPLCIYHGNCADGFTAAWAVWKFFAGRGGCDFHAGVYQDPPPDVLGRDVILVDFSYKRDVLKEMRRKANSMLVLDHHKTAAADLANEGGNFGIDIGKWEAPLNWDRHMQNVGQDGFEGVHDSVYVLFDMERSGAGIAWDFFFGDKRPALVDYVEDRDLWRFQLPWSREVNAAIFSYDYTFENWEKLFFLVEARESIVAEGAAIERKHHKDVAELTDKLRRRMTIGGHEVWAASLPYTLTSDAGHLMAKDEPFAACYWDTPEGRVFSLRSTDDGLDVSEIAKQYGGGGHRNASGFRLPHGVNP